METASAGLTDIDYSVCVVGLDCREHVPSSITDGFPSASPCDLIINKITIVRPSWETWQQLLSAVRPLSVTVELALLTLQKLWSVDSVSLVTLSLTVNETLKWLSPLPT